MTMGGHRPLVVFDLDGTITDPGVGIRNGYRAAFDAVSMSAPADEVIDSWIGPPLRVAFPALGIPDDRVEDAVSGYRARYNESGWRENTVYEHMPHVLDTLTSEGHALAVATSKPQELARRILDHFALADRFLYIGGATLDTSRDTKAAVIAHVMSETGRDGGVMIGDRSADVVGAAAHGIATIGVEWGYGDHDELMSAGAAITVDGGPGLLAAVRDMMP